MTEGKRFSTCTRFSTSKAPRSKMSLVVDLGVLHPTGKGEGACPSNDIQDDELSMLAGKTRVCIRHTGAATRFFFGIFGVVISYFIRCSRCRHGRGALSKTVENGVSMTHLFCKHCAAASSQSVGSSSSTLHAARGFCRGLRFWGSLEKKAL